MSGRILVIRGGAIGDFILTLPALKLLRENFPQAHLEVLGYKHIVSIAEGRFYADATRCIEYAPMAGFFNPRSELAAELVEYFSSFQQIVSYLYDPNGYFEANLRRAGARNILCAHSPIDDSEHVSAQLARPLQKMALYLESSAATIHPNPDDALFARRFLAQIGNPFVAIHPGSGSARKNWPVERWQAVAAHLTERDPAVQVLLVGGEADGPQMDALSAALGARVRIVRDMALPHLGAVLGRAQVFLGHDSGISHLAAAAGAPCLLLFGPTEPALWAPANPGVQVLEAPGKDLESLAVATVIGALDRLLG